MMAPEEGRQPGFIPQQEKREMNTISELHTKRKHKNVAIFLPDVNADSGTVKEPVVLSSDDEDCVVEGKTVKFGNVSVHEFNGPLFGFTKSLEYFSSSHNGEYESDSCSNSKSSSNSHLRNEQERFNVYLNRKIRENKYADLSSGSLPNIRQYANQQSSARPRTIQSHTKPSTYIDPNLSSTTSMPIRGSLRRSKQINGRYFPRASYEDSHEGLAKTGYRLQSLQNTPIKTVNEHSDPYMTYQVGSKSRRQNAPTHAIGLPIRQNSSHAHIHNMRRSLAELRSHPEAIDKHKYAKKEVSFPGKKTSANEYYVLQGVKFPCKMDGEIRSLGRGGLSGRTKILHKRYDGIESYVT